MKFVERYQELSMLDFQRKKTKFTHGDLLWENFNCRYIKSYICILFQSASDGRYMRNTECTPSIRMYMFPCRPLMISLATELVVIVEHSCEGTHWHYSVPSERLTRETFHCAVRTNDTRTPGTFTEKKRAALAQPVVVCIVSSFKQLFTTRSAYLHSIHAAPGVRALFGAIESERFSRWHLGFCHLIILIYGFRLSHSVLWKKKNENLTK